jgi:MFS superfamily sulfate permease-like transporter
MSCLSAVVIYALKNTLLKIIDGYKLFITVLTDNNAQSWIDFMLWITTFSSVIIWDPSTGILIGIFLNLVVNATRLLKRKFRP